MASTAADKAAFNEKVKAIKGTLDELEKSINAIKKEIEKTPAEDTAKIFKLKIRLCQRILAETSYYLVSSRLSQKLLSFKNEAYLNEARKNFYVFCQVIEEMVGNVVDGIDEQGDNLVVLDGLMENLLRFELFKKAGFMYTKLERLYGENSKWKWSFVDLEARLFNTLKNFIHFKVLLRDLDPSVPGYNDRMDLMTVVQKGMDKAAERFRNKYELTGKAIDDMKSALTYVGFLKRLAAVTGDQDQVANCKKKIETWTKKLNDDYSVEEQKKTKAGVK